MTLGPMSAREVEKLGDQLRTLRTQAIWRLVLAALALGSALAASQLRRDLAIPLLFGGLVLGGLGCRDFVRREYMLDEAARDRDTFTLAPVRGHAARFATMKRRRFDAASIRRLLRSEEPSVAVRIEPNREVLGRLAEELERDDLTFDPACAVLLDRLLLHPEESALYAAGRSAADVHSSLLQIEAGLRP
jgi:hypothetical protein